jgi:gluconate 2-dehydrogenase gamma chain
MRVALSFALEASREQGRTRVLLANSTFDSRRDCGRVLAAVIGSGGFTVSTGSSRRAFLTSAGSAAGKSLILLSLPALISARVAAQAAQASMTGFKTLGQEEAAELAAVAARIIPTDTTPGATEAGAIYFIDNVLGTSRAEVLAPVRLGLASLTGAAQSTYDSPTFRSLGPGQQDALLRAIETTPFFDTMRYLTIAGTFSLPEHGGNRNGVGWGLLGFEMRHMWEPPFGFYDAEYAREGR